MNITTNTTMKAIRQLLILPLLPAAVAAQATCLTDAPEIGDIGPGSELVCDQLGERFTGAELAVEGRSIQSPTQVSVLASVEGTQLRMRYELIGYAWQLSATENDVADAETPGADLTLRR